MSTTLVENLPLVSTTSEANVATGTAGVVDSDSKFATGVNDIVCKFVAGGEDTHPWQIMGTLSVNHTGCAP